MYKVGSIIILQNGNTLRQDDVKWCKRKGKGKTNLGKREKPTRHSLTGVAIPQNPEKRQKTALRRNGCIKVEKGCIKLGL